MSLLTYEEIFRAFLLGSMSGFAICVGYFLAIYQKHKVIDELKQSANELRESLRVCRDACRRIDKDADTSDSD